MIIIMPCLYINMCFNIIVVDVFHNVSGTYHSALLCFSVIILHCNVCHHLKSPFHRLKVEAALNTIMSHKFNILTAERGYVVVSKGDEGITYSVDH